MSLVFCPLPAILADKPHCHALGRHFAIVQLKPSQLPPRSNNNNNNSIGRIENVCNAIYGTSSPMHVCRLSHSRQLWHFAFFSLSLFAIPICTFVTKPTYFQLYRFSRSLSVFIRTYLLWQFSVTIFNFHFLCRGVYIVVVVFVSYLVPYFVLPVDCFFFNFAVIACTENVSLSTVYFFTPVFFLSIIRWYIISLVYSRRSRCIIFMIYWNMCLLYSLFSLHVCVCGVYVNCCLLLASSTISHIFATPNALI